MTKNRNTEQKIFEAATQLFLEKGVDRTSVRDIANKAGINLALMNYYFRSKEKLFETIFREAFEKLIPQITDVFSSDLPFYDKIRAFTGAYITMAVENPFIPMFVLNAMHSDPQHFQKMFGDIPKRIPILLVKAEIKKAVDEGLIRPIDPPQLVMNMLSLCLFPFIARPMFQLVMDMSDIQFKKLMEQRKTEVADFIIQSIK